MKTFRREDYLGTKREQYVLWTFTALLTALMAYFYYGVANEEPAAMWPMIIVATAHFVADLAIVIDKKVDELLEKEE